MADDFEDDDAFADQEEELVEEDQQDEADEEEYEEEDEGPQARTPMLVLVLIFLNVLAALAFVYLLAMNFKKRQDWSYAVFLHDLAIQGLPLKEEDDATSASRAIMPHQRVTVEQLRAAYSDRMKGKTIDNFIAVDEPFKSRIQPRHLTREALKDHFGDMFDEKIVTLENEVERLKAAVPKLIEEAANKTVAGLKDDDAKRKKAAEVLLPLCFTAPQVVVLSKKIEDAKGAALTDLLTKGVQRRLYVDILAPLETFRPGNADSFFLEKVAEVDSITLGQVEELFKRRCDQASAGKFDSVVHHGKEWEGVQRGTLEKRAAIGLLILAIAQAQAPDGNPLVPRGLERAPAVLGMYEFAFAAQAFADMQRQIEQRWLEAIHIDREGFEVDIKGKLMRGPAFIDQHAHRIERIKTLMLDLRKAEKRLDEVQEQNVRARKLYEERVGHVEDTLAKLAAARRETNRLVTEVRTLQDELFRAQRELADAAEINFRREQEIRQEERLRGLKTP